MSFENKVAIVTGAGQGIGFGICRMLAERGAKIILNDIDPTLAERASKTINQSYPNSCVAVAGNSANLDFIKNLVAAAVDLYGRLDIAIANAGITLFGDFFTYSTDSFSKVMDVNLGGTFFLAQAAAIQMRKQQTGGSLLFTSSAVGHRALKDLAAYAMSKAALEMLAKNLVIELSQYKINVNTVAPGATLTERTLQEADYEKVWAAITPMGRAGTVADVANAILFLVSDEARHITGQNILVDGGWTSVSTLPSGIR